MKNPPQVAAAVGQGVRVQLSRDLGFLDIVMVGLGPTIGSTIFLLVGPGVKIAGPSILLAFGLNFFVTILTAMAYMELSSAFPETGGGYLWIKKSMPQPLGFLGGWMSWFGHSIVCSFYILGFGYGLAWLLEAYGVELGFTFEAFGTQLRFTSDILARAFSIIIALIFIIINYRGARTFGKSESSMTLLLVAIIVIFIIFGLLNIAARPQVLDTSLHPFFASTSSWEAIQKIFIAMAFTFIVFEGYEIIAQCGEECKSPEKNIPKAQFLCIGLSTAIFLLVTFVALGSAGWQQVAAWDTAAIANVAAMVMENFGLQIIVVGIALGAIAALNSMIFSSSRVSFAMARDNALPSVLSKVHPKWRTPHLAILASGAIILAFTAAVPVSTIVASAGIMFLLLFLLVNTAVIILRLKMPQVKRYYIMPLFPVIPIVGIVTKLVLAASLFQYEPLAWYVAIFWISIGLFFHFFYGGKKEIGAIVPVEKIELLDLIATHVAEAGAEGYRIVVPVVNLEDTSIAEMAALIARNKEGEMTLVHVVEVPKTLPPKSVKFSFVDDRIKALGRLEGEAREMGAQVNSAVRISHRVYETIIDAVQEEKADMMVLGWRPPGLRKDRRIFGSNIDYLVQRAPCDVVVFKTEGLKKRLRNILVLAWPTRHSLEACDLAIMIAKEHGAKLTVLTVIRDKAKEALDMAYSGKFLDKCKEAGVQYAHKAVYSPSIIYSVVLESVPFDLLVIGASHRWVLKQYAFGPNIDAIAKVVSCPLLLVRKRGAEKPVEEELLPEETEGM